VKTILWTGSACLFLCLAHEPLAAAVLAATNTTIKSVFATAKDGDTIVLSGIFGRTNLADRSFANSLTIDASNASFNGQLTMRAVAGVKVRGGLFSMAPGDAQKGLAVRVDFSDRVSFLNVAFVGAGVATERGLAFVKSTNVLVKSSRFTGLRQGIGLDSVTGALLTGNNFVASTSDGIDIANSHDVTAIGNLCKGTIPSLGAHPDCIQLWSVAGQPMQSDIRLLDNKAYGFTQGFTSFDPDAASGIRISIIGNWVETSMPQGIACYGCFDSVITGNTLITLPGAKYRTFLRVPGGTNNIVADNNIGPLPPSATGGFLEPTAAFEDDALAMGFARSANFEADALPTRLDDSFAAMGAAGDVPEPSIWLQFLVGFGCAGAFLRRRQAALA
jgi:hypothetical protein